MIVYRELSSLEKDLGFPAKTLYVVSNNLRKHYHKVQLPKKSGGTRTLSVPDELLKLIQRKITDVLLISMPVSQYAKQKPFELVKEVQVTLYMPFGGFNVSEKSILLELTSRWRRFLMS